jgi:hypothetical protein
MIMRVRRGPYRPYQNRAAFRNSAQQDRQRRCKVKTSSISAFRRTQEPAPGSARPRPRRLGLDFQERLLPQDQPLPGTLCTMGPTARLAGAYRRFRCRNARTFRRNRPESGAGRPPRCVEPLIHGSSRQSPVPWRFCSRPPPAHLRFFRSGCSPSLAIWKAQPALSLRRRGNLQDQFVSYNLSTPTI